MKICIYIYFHSLVLFVKFACKDYSMTKVMNMQNEL